MLLLIAKARGTHATEHAANVEMVRKRTLFVWPLGTLLWK